MTTPRSLLLLALLLVACNRPARPLTFPRVGMTLPEEIPEPDEAPPPREAPVEAPPPKPRLADLPDPPVQKASDLLVVKVRWAKGELSVVSVSRVHEDTPRETPRQMGRFALEAWQGGDLLERYRFDFALLGAEDDESIAGGLTTETRLLFPDLGPEVELRVLDRKTSQIVTLTVPPVPGEAGSVASPDAQGQTAP
jgi:hypothetical protein